MKVGGKPPLTAYPGIAGKCEACGLSVVQLDYDEELGPLRGVYGTMNAEGDLAYHQER